MDAIELALPESVIAVTKLMGSGGFGGGGGGDVGTAIGKVENGQSEANSLIILPSVGARGQRAKIPPAQASEPAFLYKIPDTQRFVTNGQPSSCHGGDTSKDLKQGDFSASQSLIPGPQAKQLHQRSGKVAKSNSGSLKRSRIVQLEFSKDESCVEDIKGNSSGFGSGPTKCIIAEKAQTSKQRNNLNVKRGDKRNYRAPKSRGESFCLKNGLVGFSSVAGGGDFLAAYGSKSDVFDVTKPVDELPLNELLDGSFKRLSLIKDKGKAVQESNENLLNSLRKACALLGFESPVPAQNSVEVDNNYNQNVSMSPFSTAASRADAAKADSCIVHEHCSNKDSSGDVKPPAFTINSPLFAPKDVLERLVLPPSKELDSLLLDAVKPASSSRNGAELRVGKTVSHRNGLPPFTWSHNSSGHSKSGPDAVKISASRTTCPGRWVKVGNTPTLTPSQGSNGLLVDLKSLTYDQRLVPVGNLECSPLGVENVSSKYVNISSSEQVVLSSATCSVSQVPAADHSPRLLSAAETLCEIASHSLKRSSQEMTKWLKKSQKTIKACKLKLSQKSDILGVAPKASTGPDNLVKVSDGIFASKKIRLSMDEKSDIVCHANLARKGPINWSAPRSIRSSPSKPLRESVPEMKNYNNNIVKKSFMMLAPTRVTDRAYNSRQKLQQIGSVDWNPTASNLD